jgi:superfamily II DNA/RNA helicase
MSVQHQDLAKNAGIDRLNLMQEACINSFETSTNVQLLAPTGSGKTLAFLLSTIPFIEKNGTLQLLIISPTRELALQIRDVVQSLRSGLKQVVVYGGHSFREERASLSETPEILIATPGRLNDHIRRETTDLSNVHMLVLDEFDKILQMGFETDLQAIVTQLPSQRKTILVSATTDAQISDYLRFDNPSLVDYLPKGQVKEQRIIEISWINQDIHQTALELLCNLPTDKTILFCNLREQVVELTDFLNDNGIPALSYHGGMEQDDRERAIFKFSNGSAFYLVASDLGSRGLDIDQVAHIIHAFPAQDSASYTHRNGRTSRQEHEGLVFILKDPSRNLPDYMICNEKFDVLEGEPLPDLPQFKTIYIGGGKKDKINKVDIVGFLCQIGGCEKSDIGKILVRDRDALVAVNAHIVEDIVPVIRDQKIKGKKVKIGFAR